MNARRSISVAVLAVLALSGAACGGDGDNAADTTTSTTEEEATTTTEEEATTTTEEEDEETTTTADLESEDDGDLEAFAESLLITAEELDFDEFEAGEFTPDDDDENPCGNPVPDIEADAHVGTILTNSAQTLQLQEEIQVFADANEAADVYEAGIDAIDCSESADGQFQIGDATDVTSDVDGADQAIAFAVSGDDFEGAVVGVLFSDSIVTFTFIASPPDAADDPSVPDPLSVASFGMGKITDAVG